MQTLINWLNNNVSNTNYLFTLKDLRALYSNFSIPAPQDSFIHVGDNRREFLSVLEYSDPRCIF